MSDGGDAARAGVRPDPRAERVAAPARAVPDLHAPVRSATPAAPQAGWRRGLDPRAGAWSVGLHGLVVVAIALAQLWLQGRPGDGRRNVVQAYLLTAPEPDVDIERDATAPDPGAVELAAAEAPPPTPPPTPVATPQPTVVPTSLPRDDAAVMKVQPTSPPSATPSPSPSPTPTARPTPTPTRRPQPTPKPTAVVRKAVEAKPQAVAPKQAAETQRAQAAAQAGDDSDNEHGVFARIRDRWLLPPRLPAKLRCSVRIEYRPDGRIVRAVIAESSGNNLFDDSVIRAIYKSDPLPVTVMNTDGAGVMTLMVDLDSLLEG